MKKLIILSALLFLVFALRAQVGSDSTHHRRITMENRRYHGGGDSLHRRDRGAFMDGRGQFFNRYHSNNRDQHFRGWSRNDRSSSFQRRNRFGGPGSRIHFTPEQRKQSLAISEDYRKKAADLYKNDNLTLREYKSQLLVLQKEKKSNMQSLLTTEQKDQLAQRKKQSIENAQVRDAAYLERMRLRLQLSDAQAANIKSQRADFRTQMRSIHENEEMLPYQKMEQIRALASKNKDIMKSVLTPDQYTQFENMHTQRLGGK